MGVFVITNGEGTYIRKDETTGKYVPIRSIKHAAQWDRQDQDTIGTITSTIGNICLRNGYKLIENNSGEST